MTLTLLKITDQFIYSFQNVLQFLFLSYFLRTGFRLCTFGKNITRSTALLLLFQSNKWHIILIGPIKIILLDYWLRNYLPGFSIEKGLFPPSKTIWILWRSTSKLFKYLFTLSVQFISVTQSCQTLFDPMNHSTPGLPVHHQLLEFTQTHVHRVGDPLLSPSLAFNLSQHQGLFKWVSSSHQVAKVLGFQLQHQFFQWIFRTDLP